MIRSGGVGRRGADTIRRGRGGDRKGRERRRGGEGSGREGTIRIAGKIQYKCRQHNFAA